MALEDDARKALRAARIDPLLTYNFLVTLVETSDRPEAVLSSALGVIRDIALGGFAECSGLELTIDIEERDEGGNNRGSLKFPSRAKWTNLRLKRGVTFSDDLWNWHYDFVEGKYGKRRDGLVILQNDLHIPIKLWHFRRGIPVKWSGPSFNASRSEVGFEEIEIAHEGLRLISATGLLDMPLDVSI